jgi:hypothetical protein
MAEAITPPERGARGAGWVWLPSELIERASVLHKSRNGRSQMRYKPRSVAALQIAVGGFPDAMRVETDKNISVSAKTVGELRKVTAWPENLAVTRARLKSVRPLAQNGPRPNRSGRLPCCPHRLSRS